MTKEGYESLVAELHRLEAVEMPKASAAIAVARDKGDLSENSEYDAAKEAQAHLADKINQLKLTIADAKIIDKVRFFRTQSVGSFPCTFQSASVVQGLLLLSLGLPRFDTSLLFASIDGILDPVCQVNATLAHSPIPDGTDCTLQTVLIAKQCLRGTADNRLAVAASLVSFPIGNARLGPLILFVCLTHFSFVLRLLCCLFSHIYSSYVSLKPD